MRTLVLVSGRGSNLRSIASSIDAGRSRAELIAVLSDKRDAPALAFAESRGIATKCVPFRPKDRAQWSLDLATAAKAFNPELVVLAGFMRILDANFIDVFAGRIINVHPSLLPAFPGHNGPEQAIAAKVRVSGCTVHVVDHGVDTGPILAQAVVRVYPSDTAVALHERIQAQEHVLLPAVVARVADGSLVLPPTDDVPRTKLPAPSESVDSLVSPAWLLRD